MLQVKTDMQALSREPINSRILLIESKANEGMVSRENINTASSKRMFAFWKLSFPFIAQLEEK